jgi:MFS family permease
MRLADVLTRTLVVYLASRFAIGTATMMLRAAIAWHVFQLTHSAFHLGLIGLLQFLPAFALTLVAGALADSADRRRIMMVAQIVLFACGTILFLATAKGTVTVGLLYAMVMTAATATAFDSPARMAFLPSLVEREAFPRVVTISATNQALAFATGPALGGLLIADLGIAAAYAAYAVLIVVAFASLAMLPSPPAAPSGRGVSFAVIREGLHFVRSRPVVLGCMTLDMFAVIFGGATALLPIYASDILQVGPRGYGLLSSTLEVGALVTSLVLTTLPPIQRAGRALLIAVGVYGLATIIFGLSRSFPLSLVAYMLVGVADQVSVVMRSTTIQLSTPDELRGRVSAVNLLFIGASNQLGAAESGFLAAATSATFAVVSGGIASLVVLAIVALTIPQLRTYRTDR